MRGQARAALVLGVVALVTFGAQARRLGFYLDDWVMLERLLDAPGWWAGVKSLAQTNYAFRTLSLFVFPTLFKLFGTAPFGWQATLIVLDWALAWLFYVWVRGWTESERLALTAASLAIMLPICPSSHHWITNVSQKLALPLCVGALELHRRWLEDRTPRLLAGALAAYGASLLLYESATFFPAVQAAAYFALLRRKGKPARSAARKAARDVLVPFGAALVVATAWRLLYPLVFGQGFPVSPGFKPGPFFRDYLMALDSWGPEALAVIWRVTAAWRDLLSDGEKIFAGLFTVGLAWRLSRPWTERPDGGRLVV